MLIQKKNGFAYIRSSSVLTATVMKLKDSGIPLHDSVAVVEDVAELRKNVGSKKEVGWYVAGECGTLRNASTQEIVDG